jgi:hypothetical protein
MARSKPVILAQSILTGLGILFAGTALTEVVDPVLPALGALLVIAAKGSIDFYVNATTTLTSTVVATQEKAGAPVIAGPQSTVTTGDELSSLDRVDDVVASMPPPTPVE